MLMLVSALTNVGFDVMDFGPEAISIIGLLLTQSAGAMYWAGKVSTKIAHLEEQVRLLIQKA